MMSKTIYRLMAALLMTLGVFSSQAQNAVHPKAYYDAITYTWTDASGATHENAITDVATDPYQMVALLKKVYCDPNIPGTWYSAYTQSGEREREVYYGAVSGGWDISANDVTKPIEEGYTLLMVSVSDNVSPASYNSERSESHFTQTSELVDYFIKNVKSVQLLADGLRIGEGENAGTAFNISGEYDRFFILSKGQARQKDPQVVAKETNGRIYGELVPFKQMFEQFSPTDGSDGSQITDFYAKMVDGQLYGVVHDCASVIDVEHYFSMAGKDTHQVRSLTGLNIFIPDYRLLYWEDHEYYIHYTNGTTSGPYDVDGRTMNPYKRLNGTTFRNEVPNLCANYAQYNPAHAPEVGIYTIKLNGKAEPATEDRKYDVILDWTSSLDEMAKGTVGQNYILYLVIYDEYGNEVRQEIIETTETTYSYPVDQNEHSYTLSYIVYGQPNDGEHDMFVAWSNQADVIIPGWNDFLTLTLNHYESDYKQDYQSNFYRNFLNVRNDDAASGLTPERINNGENSFTLYRYDINDATPIPVANLTLSGNNTIRYNISYENQTTTPGYNVSVNTNGTLSVQNGIINMNDIMFVDQFAASTALNEHPTLYYYVLVLDNSDKSTNTVEVPVFKANDELGGYYTDAEVMGDIDPELTPNVVNGAVEINLLANPSIYYYTVDRGYKVEIPNEEISNMQLRTDGTFMEMSDALGLGGKVIDAGDYTLMDSPIVTGTAGDFMTYQTVIWTHGEDRVNNTPTHIDNVNSYGHQIMKTGVTDLKVEVGGTRSDNQYSNWRDENKEWCSIYNPIITVTATLPAEASVEYEPYMVRVWRDCDNIRNSVIVENGHRANDWWSPRPVHELIIDQFTNETYLTFGSAAGNEYAFGATNSANISFVVRYYYKVFDASKASNDTPMYYVVETTYPWISIPTSVVEISTATEGVSTFYNAQGISSDKPFDGVNIVVTTYSDGSTKITKVVR